MSLRLRLSILVLSVVIAFYVVVGGLLPRYGVVVGNNDPYSQFQIFQEVLSRVVNDYVDEPDLERVRVGALRGLCEGLDAYSAYLTPEQVRRISDSKTSSVSNPQSAIGNRQLEGESGMVLSKVGGYIYVVSVAPGGPAERSGVGAGDVIEYIGTRATRDMSLYEARDLLVGEVGREVELKLLPVRGGAGQTGRVPITVRVKLDRFRRAPAAVVAKLLEPGAGSQAAGGKEQGAGSTVRRAPSSMRPSPGEDVGALGYVKVGNLEAGAAREIIEAIVALSSQGVDRLILDLRGVAGGRLSEALDVANAFIGQGTLCEAVGPGRVRRRLREADPASQRYRSRLVVLINRSTMGAAEVLAAAIGESRRGELVGERTFGAAGEQEMFRLRDGGAIILTTVKYAGPSGKPIMGVSAATSGVMPSEVVEQASGGREPGAEEPRSGGAGEPGAGVLREPGSGGARVPAEDVVLRRAVEMLRAQH